MKTKRKPVARREKTLKQENGEETLTNMNACSSRN
jgi:hypothetical protein